VLLAAVALFIVSCDQNTAPETPTVPGGPSGGEIGITYTFLSAATDPDSDEVAVRFDWGDGEKSDWTNLVTGGTMVSMSHAWDDAGTYEVMAQAKDAKGATSEWSTAATIAIITQTAPVTVTLTWGRDPDDLDAHMWTPSIGGTVYHVYYSDKGSYSVAPYCSLDLDDTYSYGPEHMLLSQTETGTYTFAVHHFSGDSTITTSGAMVQVYRQGQPVQTFNVPTGASGDEWWWHVFEMDGTTRALTTLNVIDSLPPEPYTDGGKRK
jgi:hypothetical protein